MSTTSAMSIWAVSNVKVHAWGRQVSMVGFDTSVSCGYRILLLPLRLRIRGCVAVVDDIPLPTILFLVGLNRDRQFG